MPGWGLAALSLVVFAEGLAHARVGHRVTGLQALRRIVLFDPLAQRLRRAARAGQVAETRRAGPSAGCTELLATLDSEIFGRAAPRVLQTEALREFARAFGVIRV